MALHQPNEHCFLERKINSQCWTGQTGRAPPSSTLGKGPLSTRIPKARLLYATPAHWQTLADYPE